MRDRDSWLAVALAVLGALAAEAIWPGSAHVAAFLVNPLITLGLP